MNDNDKRKIIKSLIQSQKADLICLQETKVQMMSRDLVRCLSLFRSEGDSLSSTPFYGAIRKARREVGLICKDAM